MLVQRRGGLQILKRVKRCWIGNQLLELRPALAFTNSAEFDLIPGADLRRKQGSGGEPHQGQSSSFGPTTVRPTVQYQASLSSRKALTCFPSHFLEAPVSLLASISSTSIGEDEPLTPGGPASSATRHLLPKAFASFSHLRSCVTLNASLYSSSITFHFVFCFWLQATPAGTALMPPTLVTL